MIQNRREESGNRILDRLPGFEFERLMKVAEPHPLELGATLIAPTQQNGWTFFPVEGVVSLVREFDDGTLIEVGVIGREGMVGFHSFLGPATDPTRALVQCDGSAYRIPSEDVRKEFGRGGALQQLLLDFTYSLMTQLSLSAACNQLHTMEQRLARWLLAMNDRISDREIPLSHEFLAHMLGTGRARVTAAIGRLRGMGAVSSGRNRIEIIDRDGLVAAACECYLDIRRSYGEKVDPSRAAENERGAPEGAS